MKRNELYRNVGHMPREERKKLVRQYYKDKAFRDVVNSKSKALGQTLTSLGSTGGGVEIDPTFWQGAKDVVNTFALGDTFGTVYEYQSSGNDISGGSFEFFVQIEDWHWIPGLTTTNVLGCFLSTNTTQTSTQISAGLANIATIPNVCGLCFVNRQNQQNSGTLSIPPFAVTAVQSGVFSSLTPINIVNTTNPSLCTAINYHSGVLILRFKYDGATLIASFLVYTVNTAAWNEVIYFNQNTSLPSGITLNMMNSFADNNLLSPYVTRTPLRFTITKAFPTVPLSKHWVPFFSGYTGYTVVMGREMTTFQYNSHVMLGCVCPIAFNKADSVYYFAKDRRNSNWIGSVQTGWIAGLVDYAFTESDGIPWTSVSSNVSFTETKVAYWRHWISGDNALSVTGGGFPCTFGTSVNFASSTHTEKCGFILTTTWSNATTFTCKLEYVVQTNQTPQLLVRVDNFSTVTYPQFRFIFGVGNGNTYTERHGLIVVKSLAEIFVN